MSGLTVLGSRRIETVSLDPAGNSHSDDTGRSGDLADTQPHHTGHAVRRLADNPEDPRGESCGREAAAALIGG